MRICLGCRLGWSFWMRIRCPLSAHLRSLRTGHCLGALARKDKDRVAPKIRDWENKEAKTPTSTPVAIISLQQLGANTSGERKGSQLLWMLSKGFQLKGLKDRFTETRYHTSLASSSQPANGEQGSKPIPGCKYRANSCKTSAMHPVLRKCCIQLKHLKPTNPMNTNQ